MWMDICVINYITFLVLFAFHILKGMCHEIFDLFSGLEPILTGLNISNSVSIPPRYSIKKFENSDSVVSAYNAF